MTHSGSNERGLTLVEVVIVLALTAAIVFTMIGMAKSSQDASVHVVAQGRAAEVAQMVINRMRSDLLASTLVFQNDATSDAYRRLLDESDEAPWIDDVLPTGTFDSTFGLERSSAERTGNTLMLVRHDRSDEFECSSGSIYQTDIVRIVRYHLVLAGNGPAEGSPIGLNMARWVSEPLIDGGAIDGIEDDADRTELLAHLRNGTADVNGEQHEKAEVVWAIGADPSLDPTLRYVDETGALSDGTGGDRETYWQILRSVHHSSDGLLSYRHFSVATNYASEGMGVGRYSDSHNVSDGFPHGFEIQIVGPSKSRQVLLQLCIVSTLRRGLPAWASLRTVAQIRDV